MGCRNEFSDETLAGETDWVVRRCGTVPEGRDRIQCFFLNWTFGSFYPIRENLIFTWSLIYQQSFVLSH